MQQHHKTLLMLMLTEKKGKKKPKLSENHKLMEQSIEQEDKEVEVGRTSFHDHHRSRVPF